MPRSRWYVNCSSTTPFQLMGFMQCKLMVFAKLLTRVPLLFGACGYCWKSNRISGDILALKSPKKHTWYPLCSSSIFSLTSWVKSSSLFLKKVEDFGDSVRKYTPQQAILVMLSSIITHTLSLDIHAGASWFGYHGLTAFPVFCRVHNIIPPVALLSLKYSCVEKSSISVPRLTIFLCCFTSDAKRNIILLSLSLFMNDHGTKDTPFASEFIHFVLMILLGYMNILYSWSYYVIWIFCTHDHIRLYEYLVLMILLGYMNNLGLGGGKIWLKC